MRTVNVRIIRRTRQLVRFETLVIALNEPNHLEIRRVSPAPSATQFWKRPEYFTALMILFFVNMADRTFGPIIPLFLEELGTPRAGLEMVAGALISVAAFGEAFSAWLSGKLASRVSLRRLITGRLVLSILVLLPMVFVYSTEQFSILRVLLALLAGGTLTLALSAAHHVIPGEHRGTGFALLSGTIFEAESWSFMIVFHCRWNPRLTSPNAMQNANLGRVSIRLLNDYESEKIETKRK